MGGLLSTDYANGAGPTLESANGLSIAGVQVNNDYMLSMQQNIMYNQQRMRYLQISQGQSDQLPSLIQVHKAKTSNVAGSMPAP